jgi:hypothetical protein
MELRGAKKRPKNNCASCRSLLLEGGGPNIKGLVLTKPLIFGVGVTLFDFSFELPHPVSTALQEYEG